MKATKGLFLALASLACAGCFTKTSSGGITIDTPKIVTRDLNSSDYSYGSSQGLMDVTVTVVAKSNIKIMTITFDWYDSSGSRIQETSQTEKEIAIKESRAFKSSINWVQALTVSKIKTQFSGTTYI